MVGYLAARSTLIAWRLRSDRDSLLRTTRQPIGTGVGDFGLGGDHSGQARNSAVMRSGATSRKARNASRYFTLAFIIRN